MKGVISIVFSLKLLLIRTKADIDYTDSFAPIYTTLRKFLAIIAAVHVM